TAALNAPGITLAPLSPKIAIESCNLHDFHGDPADRMIVATARAERLTLITSDKKILQYSKKHQVDAIPAH
ncbi:MAG: type II toxin-antitoxin system VapC family toxin, partial [Gammaproteobacteria bacterium]|nr:type II toxin-antitoxin system VapC family toxin [Gammaproteobacteria bacterium]